MELTKKQKLSIRAALMLEGSSYREFAAQFGATAETARLGIKHCSPRWLLRLQAFLGGPREFQDVLGVPVEFFEEQNRG